MTEIDQEIIKKTQDTLGKFIKKPPLTEKLLSRPPFRFLHDIVTAVISSTGFMKGLFTDSEMNSENVKEKETKLIFLDKLIGMISLVLNKSIDVKASSIVAGKESEKTNILLQCLAKAINKKVDNSTFVKMVLNGDAKKLSSSKTTTSSKEKPSENIPDKGKNNESANDESRHNNKSKTRKLSNASENIDNNKVNQSKSKKSKETNEDEKRNRKPAQEKNEPEISKEKEKPNKVHKSRNEKSEVVENENIDIKREPLESQMNTLKDENTLNDENDLESLKRLQRPSSAKGTRQKHENETYLQRENKEIENKKPMIRPPSARPAPPKLRKSSEGNLDESVNILTNQSKVSGLIVDMDQDSDEGDFIVEEFVGGGDIDMKFSHTAVDSNVEEDQNHGVLVQKIIQSKKDFKISDEKNDVINQTDLNRNREKRFNEKEIEKIRQNLQSLTKSVYPLGKLIDFIQEDLDTMQKEVDRWRIENEELDKKLLFEQNLTNKLVKPIKEKLNNEIKNISIQEESIAKLKAKIETNSKKIETMLFNVCSTSA